MKKVYSYTIVLSAFILCCFVSIWVYFLFTPAVTQDEGYVYYVRPGITKRLVVNELAQQGIITHPVLLLIYGFPQKNAALKTGEYRFAKGSTPYSIWKQITTGTGLLYHPFAIIPGWTFKQLRAELLKAQGLRHVTAALSDNQIMERLGYANLSPEGEFFPDTYYYTRGNSDLSILKRASHLMQVKLQAAWDKRSAGLPYQNPYEALIAASMIEKEGYLDSERPIIAGVLMNRLRKNMLLQIDATVIFGLGDRYDGKIYKQNLLEDTPYNTYLHKGLPPTPIAMPGLSSLSAATMPQQNDFYYYVAKGDGSHQFSTNLQAHNEAVKTNKQNKQNETVNNTPVREQIESSIGSQLTTPSNPLLMTH